MIELTAEMGAALLRALPADARWGWKAEDAKAWLTAVLALVERDYDVSPKLPEVQHRPKRGTLWNHSAEAYEAECVCGETFIGWPRSDAEDRLLAHLEREARP